VQVSTPALSDQTEPENAGEDDTVANKDVDVDVNVETATPEDNAATEETLGAFTTFLSYCCVHSTLLSAHHCVQPIGLEHFQGCDAAHLSDAARLSLAAARSPHACHHLFIPIYLHV
jgi:hypothetical protein